ncbi:MAG TPA: hypothetical protein EYH15_00920 [Methanothermococcus okinawensis]|uniref:DUF169 domain-containing protein n=1 Tax=Methanothermococcus okinawensis TaxID=155863 RepID=A0A832ZHM4_9EURY|nr:hypothetical protein [Methanothermococcus okinawensis]HIP91350.1 hypothetical protein [Methanothermococcus okinawensis]
MDIKELGKKLEELLDLEYPAVAVKLAKSKEEIPEGYEEIEEEARHCEMIQMARKEGKKFYATLNKHACKGGAYAMGLLQNPPEPLATGKLYYKLGNFATEEAARRTVEAIPKVKEKVYASVYAPLSDADFEADAIVVITTPKKALRLVQSLLYKEGGRFQGDFAGIQSLCADAVAAVKERDSANITLGCNGSRKYACIEDGELIFAFPPADLENIVEALEHFKKIWDN